jgi:hypothetical protein
LTGGNEEQLGLIREVPEGRRKGYAQALEGTGLPWIPRGFSPGGSRSWRVAHRSWHCWRNADRASLQ